MVNPFYVHPGQDFGQGLQSLAGSVQQFGQQRKQEQATQEQAEYAERAKQAMSDAFQSGDPAAIRNAIIQYPEVGETAKQMFGFTNDETEKVARQTYRQALSETDPQRRAAIMQQGIQAVQQFGGQPTNMMADFKMLQDSPEAFERSARAGYAALASDQEYEAMFGTPGSDRPAGIREFESKVEAAGLEPGTEGYKKAALVALGLEPRAGISASERIAQDPALAQRVADLERQTTAAREEGKLRTQQQMLPKIRESIKEAEQQAQSRGEALSEYERAKAAQPGLREVVDKLKALSDVATYTTGGKVMDTVIKELGFGATEGATARAKMESLVNNQILPLLRDTFGAQFTEKEGDSLRRTMMDINAAPEQKKQILDSFIEQKMRDLEMKRGRVEGTGGTAGGQMSEEEADAFINQMLEQ